MTAAKIASVYVMQGDGRVKVGRSRRPRQRLAEIRCVEKFPASLAFIASCDAEMTAAIEARAHALLAKSRHKGEWFVVSVKEAIDAVIQSAGEMKCLLDFPELPPPIGSLPRGPAPTGKGIPILIRCQPEFLAAVDQWRSEQPHLISRPEALRQLAEIGLKRGGK